MLLRNNIGTFAKEDETFDLLTRLSWQLPIFVISSAILDLGLACICQSPSGVASGSMFGIPCGRPPTSS